MPPRKERKAHPDSDKRNEGKRLRNSAPGNRQAENKRDNSQRERSIRPEERPLYEVALLLKLAEAKLKAAGETGIRGHRCRPQSPPQEIQSRKAPNKGADEERFEPAPLCWEPVRRKGVQKSHRQRTDKRSQ